MVKVTNEHTSFFPSFTTIRESKGYYVFRVTLITVAGATAGAVTGGLTFGPVGAILGLFIGAVVGYGAGVILVGNSDDRYEAKKDQERIVKHWKSA